MKKPRRTPSSSLPDELPPAEYYRRCRLGFATLRDECTARNPEAVDPELGARFVQLYELWHWGVPIDPSAVPSTLHDRWRKLPAAKIAGLCAGLLDRLEAAEREECAGGERN